MSEEMRRKVALNRKINPIYLNIAEVLI